MREWTDSGTTKTGMLLPPRTYGSLRVRTRTYNVFGQTTVKAQNIRGEKKKVCTEFEGRRSFGRN